MIRIKKIISVLFTLMLVLIIVPGTTAQAASNTGYVMDDHAEYSKVVRVGSYQVKKGNNGLYTKKGNGSWKRIVKGSISCFTTNGATIYYGSDYTESFSACSSTIYSISTSGKNKKKIKKISGGVCELYRYGNQLIYNSIPLGDGRDVYNYSLKTKKTKKLKSGVSIVYAKKQYLLLQGYGQDFSPRKLSTYNLTTKKTKTLASKTQEDKMYISGDRVYYAVWMKQGAESNTYQMKSCKLNGSSVKTNTNTFKGGSVKKVTSKYVKYYNTNWKLCTLYYK